MDAAQLASVLNVSRTSVYRRRSLGEPMPPAIRLGRSLRWRHEDVETFLESQLEQGKAFGGETGRAPKAHPAQESETRFPNKCR